MFLADLRYAVRSLSRAPGFTLAVVLTLGLGMGATTAIFSVVRGVLLRPLPHREGDRLVYLRHSIASPGGENIRFSVPEILDFRERARSFGGIAEYSAMVYTMRDADQAVRMTVGLVTGNYFDIMGLGPVLGRTLNDNDDGPSAPPVMVLTHSWWQSQFGSDTGVIGQTVRVDGKEVEIVGVLQPAPFFPSRMDALMNMVISEHHLSATMVHGRTHRMTEMIARLSPGTTVEQARAEVAQIANSVHTEFAESYDPGSHHRVTLTPFRIVLGERARLTLWLLMGAATFVLIISCANVANLSLMRGVRREHELVVRASLGAGIARLRRLLLAENLVLAAAGAALGIVLAVGGVRLLISFAERYTPRASEIRLDGVVFGFALLLTIVVALLLSWAPRLAREGALAAAIASGTTRISGNLRRQRLQRGLVVAQIAVSVVLLAGAGLLTRTLLQLSEVETGLETEEILTLEIPIDMGERSSDDVKLMMERLRVELAAIPGVSAVGIGSTVPLGSTQFQLDIAAEGRALAAGEAMPRAEYRTADPDYFRAGGIPLLRGRAFDITDRAGAGLVVILNESLARRLFPDRDPIGQRVAWTGDVLRFIPVSGDWRTVVGVVGDVKSAGLDIEPPPVIYMPFAQELSFGATAVAIRAQGSAPGLIGSVMPVVRRIAPTEPIENVLTIAQIRDESVAPRRLNAVLVSSFGLLAVVIAAVGIFGVLAFSVSARTGEIGIRMTLGADSGRVQRMILSEGGLLLGIGLLLGLAGALLATRFIRGLLFAVAPHDPVTMAVVALLMLAVGLLACWLPAVRAASINPSIAMRAQ